MMNIETKTLEKEEFLNKRLDTEYADYLAEQKRLERFQLERETDAARAEHRLQRMVFLDRECEAATRDFENLLQEFDELCLDLGRKFLAARHRIIRAQMEFGSEVIAAIPKVNKIKSDYEPAIESDLKELLGTVEKRGASLSSICSEGWQPHLHNSPVFCRNNAYTYPPTNFGALLFQIERIIAALPTEPPTQNDNVQKAA